MHTVTLCDPLIHPAHFPLQILIYCSCLFPTKSNVVSNLSGSWECSCPRCREAPSPCPSGPSGSWSTAPTKDCPWLSSTTSLRRSPGGGNDNPLQHSHQKNPRDRGTWWATVHAVGSQRVRRSTTERLSTHTWPHLKLSDSFSSKKFSQTPVHWRCLSPWISAYNYLTRICLVLVYDCQSFSIVTCLLVNMIKEKAEIVFLKRPFLETIL